jgi:glutamate/tyrosine decarboxylase-like PLP-dependent enzyme
MLSDSDDAFLSDAFAALRGYLSATDREPVSRPRSPEDLGEALPQLAAAGISYADVLDELDQILDDSVRTAHPLFLNNLLAGFEPVSWIGDVAASLLTPTMATFEVAPLLTVIEKRMASELLQLFGIEAGQGVLTTGGSNANLLALLCARSRLDPGARHAGVSHDRFRIYVSAEAHYSFDKAANISGIGTDNVVLIPCDRRGAMFAEALEARILSDMRQGLTPLMVGATAGTTVLGAFDPIDEIADICEAHGIWCHVDAAWGGGAIFCETGQALLQGSDRADSITVDAHKTLGTPLITSYFLTRHSGVLSDATRGGGGNYLFHDGDAEWNTGTYSLQCGRRADALKLWLMWRYYGTDGLGAHMDNLLELARFSQSEVERRPRLELISAQYLNICFRVRPSDPAVDVNAFTLRVRRHLVGEGRALVNYATRADGTIFFRLVLPNQQTTRADLVGLFDLIEDAAELLDRGSGTDEERFADLVVPEAVVDA